MAYCIDAIRSHAFKVIHDFEDFDDYEAEMIAFGESLPPGVFPSAKDPQYRELCKGAAVWAWEHENIIAASARSTSKRDQSLK